MNLLEIQVKNSYDFLRIRVLRTIFLLPHPVYLNSHKIFVSQTLNPSLRTFIFLLNVAQKLHAPNKRMQVVDFIDYFCRVTIEWE